MVVGVAVGEVSVAVVAVVAVVVSVVCACSSSPSPIINDAYDKDIEQWLERLIANE